jgi:hypothetical protein
MSIFLFDEEETQGKINIDELYERQQKKDLRQISIFNKILNRIHNKIKTTARSRTGDKYIWFTVPEYIFGEPVYQQSDCIAYLVDKLEDNKFYIRYMHPNSLFISWAHFVPSYVRSEIKKKMGLVVDDAGNVIEKLDIGQGDNLNERMLQKPAEKKEGKVFTPISNYKPTGNFVYDREFFEKLEKKISDE